MIVCPSMKINSSCTIYYNAEFSIWEFSTPDIEFDCTFDNPEFDLAVVDEVDKISYIIKDLEPEIKLKISKHLENWCEDLENAHILSVDVTKLVTDKVIDISYAGGDEWGDLGINIVIENGKIVETYSGD